MATRPTSHN